MAHISYIFCDNWQIYNSWYLSCIIPFLKTPLTSLQWRRRKLGLLSLGHIYPNESLGKKKKKKNFRDILLLFKRLVTCPAMWSFCVRIWILSWIELPLKPLLFPLSHLANCLCFYLIWAASQLTRLSHRVCSEKTYREIFKEDIFKLHFFCVSFL